jgi:hypothetical protein
VDSIEWHQGRLRLQLRAIDAEFVAAVDDKGSLSGQWIELGRSMPLTLKRVGEIAAPNRPQTPRPPFPYRSEEVTFASLAPGITIAGTLTLPRVRNPAPRMR